MKSKLDAIKELDSLKCVRKTKPHKLERNQLAHFIWWENHFKEIEAASKIPDYKKVKCLRGIFSEKEIDFFSKSGVEIIKDKTSEDDRSHSTDFIQLKRKHPNKRRKSKETSLQAKPHKNPYWEFMSKSKEEARSWHNDVERELKDIPVIGRAERLKNEIVKRYVTKFQSLGKSDIVNEHTVSSIFELICPFPICKAFKVTNEICGSMPEATTKHLGCIEQGKEHKLLNEIMQDMVASEKPPIQTAFGQSLPGELRRMPFKENPGAKWGIFNPEHAGIESFADVWKDITDLESTRRFCLYLLDHPEINPPPYLAEKGMLIKKILKKPVYLGNLENMFETQESPDMDMRTLIINTNKTLSAFNRKLTEAAGNSSSSLSVGEISDINIMV